MIRSMASAVPFGIMVSAAVSSAAYAGDSEHSRFTASPPSGFEQLEAERELVLDVYYGGQKRGTARVAVYGDRLEFLDPSLVLSFIEDAADRAQLLAALGRPIDANRDRACGLVSRPGCGAMSPDSVSAVLDEDRFRVDLFVASALRKVEGDNPEEFLALPDRKFSLVNLSGATVSGTGDLGNSKYRFQNRTIAAVGSARVRSDTSIEKGHGLVFDNLVAEVDHRDLRFSAGEFWVPGTDLISRRKSLAVGVSTQFDTRRNKELLLGTPIEVFLGAPSRVEAYINGQLVSSQILSAGNRALDTSRWPSGSYDVVIRVYEPGQAPREERHFFSRDEALAPLGHPSYQLYAGIYSNGTRFRGGTPFLQGALGYRLNNRTAVRATAIAIQGKAIGDLSATWMANVADFTAGGLLSSAGDVGVVFRGYTTSLKGVAASFDLRKMWSGNRGPLLPSSARTDTFDEVKLTPYDQGDFLQITGQVSARVKSATLRVSGFYRDTPTGGASYSVGPSIDVPVYRSSRFSIVAEGDARKTEFGFNSYVGLRLLLTDGAKSLAVRGGFDHAPDQPGRFRGEVQGAVYGSDTNTNWSANAAIGQNDGATYARGAGEIRTSYLNGRGELLHEFGSVTQYSLAAETGFVLGSGRAAIGAGVTKDAALIASADSSDGGDLDIFVDHVLAGTAEHGRPVVVYLDPYREYSVEARPHGASLVSTDFSARRLVAFPGTVVEAAWDVSKIFVLLGRLVDERGGAMQGMQMSGPHGVAESDDEGYFQIEAAPSEVIEAKDGVLRCRLVAPETGSRIGYVKVGDVTCR